MSNGRVFAFADFCQLVMFLQNVVYHRVGMFLHDVDLLYGNCNIVEVLYISWPQFLHRLVSGMPPGGMLLHVVVVMLHINWLLHSIVDLMAGVFV